MICEERKEGRITKASLVVICEGRIVVVVVVVGAPTKAAFVKKERPLVMIFEEETNWWKLQPKLPTTVGKYSWGGG